MQLDDWFLNYVSNFNVRKDFCNFILIWEPGRKPVEGKFQNRQQQDVEYKPTLCDLTNV